MKLRDTQCKPEACRILAGGNTPGIRSLGGMHPGWGAGSLAVSHIFPAPHPRCIMFVPMIRGCRSFLALPPANIRMPLRGKRRARIHQSSDILEPMAKSRLKCSNVPHAKHAKAAKATKDIFLRAHRGLCVRLFQQTVKQPSGPTFISAQRPAPHAAFSN